MKLYVYLLLIILFGSAAAQDYRFNGFVFDAGSRQPLKGANVFLVNARMGSMTDGDGYFDFTITQTAIDDTLEVNFLGYETYRIYAPDFVPGTSVSLKQKILSLQEKITVLGERVDLGRQEVPHSRSVIGLGQIERLGSGEISDLFKSDPAVRIVGNDLDGRKIQIRGSDADEVNVYVDGILINSLGADNASDLSIIPTESIEKIEVMKGANLLLLGNGAFGGVVNFTMRKNFRSSYSLTGKYGSASSRYISAEINVPVREGLLLNYFGQLNSMAPEIEFFSKEQFGNKTFNDLIETQKQNHHLSLHYLTDAGQFVFRSIGYLFNYSKPDWENDRANIFTAGSFKGELLGVSDLDISANYLFSDDLVKRDRNPVTRYEYDFKSQRLNIRLGKKFTNEAVKGPKLELQTLLDYFHDELKNDTRVLQNGFNNSLYHAYLYDNRASAAGVLSFGDTADSLAALSWKIYAGIRGDFIASGKNYQTNTYGFQMNLRWPAIQVRPYISYGENLKVPTLLERAYVNDVRDLSLSNGLTEQAEILPEFNSSAEVGVSFNYEPVDYYFDGLEFKFAAYSNTISNKLIQRPLESILVRTQTGKNKTSGLESSVNLSGLWRRINLTAAVNALDITDPILYPYKPETNYSLQTDYISPAGYFLTTVLFHEGRSFGVLFDQFNNYTSIEIAPFYDMDISAGYQFPIDRFKMSLRVSGYNVFDNSGYRFYYLNKRFLQVSLSLKY